MTSSKLSYPLALFACVVATAAHAIPVPKACSYYVSYSSGWIDDARIRSENAPWPLDDSTAKRSAESACFDTWRRSGGSTLGYANAGIHASVTRSGNGYTYTCWRCEELYSVAPYEPKLAAYAVIAQVESAFPDGQIINMSRHFTYLDQVERLVEIEVDVMVGPHLVRAIINEDTGELTLPEVQSVQEGTPENVCK
jgi:hypothetical protein